MPNTPNGPDADEYLFRLDFAIRRMHTETWDNEDARKSSLYGLLVARSLYTKPGAAGNDPRRELDEALAGPLVDEPDDLAQMAQRVGELLVGPERPDGWSQRDAVIRSLAVLLKSELVRARQGVRTSPAAKMAAADLVGELMVNASLDVDQLTSILREAL